MIVKLYFSLSAFYEIFQGHLRVRVDVNSENLALLRVFILLVSPLVQSFNPRNGGFSPLLVPY